eukprot:828964_1
MGVVLNIDDRYNFPAYRPDKTHNHKFLYHLLFAYPDVHILGGGYSRSEIGSKLEPQTCIARCDHRQYLTEKALKGGGIALCLNVLNRIVLDGRYERTDASLLHECNSYRCWGSIPHQLSHLHRIPQFGHQDEHLFLMFMYFGESHERCLAKEKFVQIVRRHRSKVMAMRQYESDTTEDEEDLDMDAFHAMLPSSVISHFLDILGMSI